MYTESQVVVDGPKPAAAEVHHTGGATIPLSKAVFDRVIGTLFLVASLPIQVLIAIAIRIDSRGPILFTQTRHGLNGETFMVTKFRTMHVDQGDASGAVEAKRKDDRVTRIGRFLRRSCLDELPQFWDVVRGRMSLVGPRPHPVALTVEGHSATDVIAGYRRRLRARPGITGLAQIRGNRGPIGDVSRGQARIDADNEYIDNWSLWLDVKILAATFFVVFRKGCY